MQYGHEIKHFSEVFNAARRRVSDVYYEGETLWIKLHLYKQTSQGVP
jgi:hypothetical protein